MVVVSDDEDVAVVEASEDGPVAGQEAGAALNAVDGQGEEAHSPSVADSRDAQLAKLQQKVKNLQKQVQTLTAANTTLKVSAHCPGLPATPSAVLFSPYHWGSTDLHSPCRCRCRC